jgi:hypothetical protein
MCPCGGAGQATRGFRKFLYQVTLVRIDPMEIDGTYLIHVNSIIHLWMFFMEDRRVDTLSSAPRPAENNIPMEVPLDCLSHPFKADLEKKPCKDCFFGLCHIADGCCCTICLLFKFT